MFCRFRFVRLGNTKNQAVVVWRAKRQFLVYFFFEIAELGGGYFGPPKLSPPACKLSPKGAETLARYNAYLAELTLATLKVHATGAVTSAVESAATNIDGHVRGNAVVGKLLDAKDVLAAKLNATMNG